MTITRIGAGWRMSRSAIHGNTAYLTDQVGAPGKSVTRQTETIRSQVEELPMNTGPEKSKTLSTMVTLVADRSDLASSIPEEAFS